MSAELEVQGPEGLTDILRGAGRDPAPALAPATGADQMITQAIASGASIDVMERLLAMRRELREEESRVAYYAAMSAVESELPAIVRDADNDQTRSKYARLEKINAAITPVYTRHGISLSFDTADCPTPGEIRTVCHVSHAGGYSTTRHVDLPPDGVGLKGNANKTEVHARGSTLSYARRYLALLVFNVQLANEDDDGNASGAAWIERLLQSCATARDWLPSIVAIKAGMSEGGDITAAAEAYAEMPRAVISDLFIATTKGGLFTPAERAIAKDSKEFHDLVHALRHRRQMVRTDGERAMSVELIMLWILAQPAHPGCAPGAPVAELAPGCATTITVPAGGETLLRLGDGVLAS